HGVGHGVLRPPAAARFADGTPRRRRDARLRLGPLDASRLGDPARRRVRDLRDVEPAAVPGVLAVAGADRAVDVRDLRRRRDGPVLGVGLVALASAPHAVTRLLVACRRRRSAQSEPLWYGLRIRRSSKTTR